MKKNFLLISVIVIFSFYNCNGSNTDKNTISKSSTSNVTLLTNDSFKKKVFNYELNKQWKYEGDKPALVDFYADWCGPCRVLSPVVEEIAKEYAGKIVVYKVDTDAEPVLSRNMGISSLPTLLFIPVNGQPQVAMGALPKETLVKAINDVLLKKQ